MSESDAWADIGHTVEPRKRAPRPRARLETVRWDVEYSEWVACLVKADGKRVWLYRGSEEEANEAAREELARWSGR